MAPKKQRDKFKARKRDKEPAEKPVSLAPLSFEDAVKELAQVRPTPKKKAVRG